MLFQYPRVGRTTQTLKDLIKINNDRIGCYQAALHQSAILDEETRQVFRIIIGEGIQFRHQLQHKVKQRECDGRSMPNLLGKVYSAWNDLKVAFACDTQKTIINNCLHNEEMALQAYNEAMGKISYLNSDIAHLLNAHKRYLQHNYEILKGQIEGESIADNFLIYPA